MIEEHDLIRHLRDGGDDLWNPTEPPAFDFAAITGETPSTSAAPAAGRRSQSRRWWQPAMWPAAGFAAGAMACVALGLGLGAVIFGGAEQPPTPLANRPVPAPTQQVSLARLADAPAGATAVASVFASTNGDTVDLRVTGLPPLPPGSFYEIWALGTKGRLVSLGNISVDAGGNGAASMALPVSLAQFPVLDVSLEPADGNPGHSGRSLLRSPA